MVCRRFGTLYQFHLQGLDVKYTLHPALEDGTDRGFRNVGKPQSDAGETPKRILTRFKTRRKFEIKNINNVEVNRESQTESSELSCVSENKSEGKDIFFISTSPFIHPGSNSLIHIRLSSN